MGKGRFWRFVAVLCKHKSGIEKRWNKDIVVNCWLLFIFSHHGFVTTKLQGSCNFANCTFAHGEHELRGVSRGSTNKFEFHCRHCLSWQFICINPGRLSSDKDFSVEVFFLGGSRFFMKRCRSLWCQSCMSWFTGNRWLQFRRNHQIWLRRRVVSHGQKCKNINASQLKWYETKSHLKPDWWNEMAADRKQSTVNVDLRHTDEVCLCSAISAFSASSFNLFNSFQVFSKNRFWWNFPPTNSHDLSGQSREDRFEDHGLGQILLLHAAATMKAAAFSEKDTLSLEVVGCLEEIRCSNEKSICKYANQDPGWRVACCSS